MYKIYCILHPTYCLSDQSKHPSSIPYSICRSHLVVYSNQRVWKILLRQDSRCIHKLVSHNTLNLNYNHLRILRISPDQNSMSLDSLFSKCPFHPSLFLYAKGSHSKYLDCTWDSLGACMTPIHQVHQSRFDLNISIKTSMCYFISQINQLAIHSCLNSFVGLSIELTSRGQIFPSIL